MGLEPTVNRVTYRELQERRELIQKRMRDHVESERPAAQAGSVAVRASGDRPLFRRLLRSARRPSARGDPAHHGEGRRLRRDPRRRRRLQAAQLDERPEHARRTDGDRWVVTNPKQETLTITLHEVLSDVSSTNSATIRACRRTASRRTCRSCWRRARTPSSPGLTLVRREYPTAIGPIDLVCRDVADTVVAVEVKRRGEIDGVEQLARYIERLQLDSSLGDRARACSSPRSSSHRPRCWPRPAASLGRGRLRRATRYETRRAPAVLKVVDDQGLDAVLGRLEERLLAELICADQWW
jgi:hypothetical protein